jgi:hypothetical protein
MRGASYGMTGTWSRRTRLLVGTALASALLLAGCSTGQPVAEPSAPASTPTDAASATPETPAPLALDAAGTAEDNIAYFTSVVTGFLGGSPDANGRDIIDHLVASGFDKAEMELTADTTAVGLEADNIQFSVRMNGTCLIGQNGNVGVHTITAPLLATGTCLVGNTRAIDW